MASLTAFFKPVDAPAAANKQGKATAAAAGASSSSPAASPAKPTAASRKRKAESDESKEGGDGSGSPIELSASALGPDAIPDLQSPAKKQRGEGLDELIPASWLKVLKPEFSKAYWPSIEKFLKSQDAAKVKVFPPRGQIFRALDLCSFDDVKVVILGQDPYHDIGQAEGLCFSVPPTVSKIPSSLNNIYKELGTDLGPKNFTKPKHGNLVKWAQQGILLLNTGLTVEAHKANSHKSVGWFNFTDAIIRAIAKEKKGVVFLLWGAHAQAKAKLIDQARHHVLNAAHPSGLSASKGFFGCKHFSKTNAILEKEGKKPIDWQV